METIDTLKKQRDQFLAFAFASADLFLEINADGGIVFAIGAAKSLTGQDIRSWIGKNWLDLFAPYEKGALEALQKNGKAGQRRGPDLFDIDPDIANQKCIVTGIQMPNNPNFYVTLSFSDALSTHLAEIAKSINDRHIMDVPQFTLAAEDAALKAKSSGYNIQIGVFDLGIEENDHARYGDAVWKEVMEGLNDILMDSSIDKRSAARVSESRYTVVQDENTDIMSLQGKLVDFTKSKDPEGQGLKVTSKAITSNLSTIDPKDISKVIVYTVREFERRGTDMMIDNLNSGFVAYAKANAEKVKELKTFIKQSDFKINFQPIVNFETRSVDHYEMRCSFEQGDTQEWVMFGEDIGLSSAFDLAICERAIGYINYKAGATRTKFSINISAKSFEDTSFYPNLKKLLDEHKDKNIAGRLMFEITEAPFITNTKRMNAYIKALSKDGFTVMLDDFEPNPHAMEHLRPLDPHGVKVDGKIIGKIASSPVDMVALKKLAAYCLENDKIITAKAIEDEKQIGMLRDIGITMGQGYAFGKPSTTPEYNPIS